MSMLVGLTERQAELLNVLDDVAHGNHEQRHHDAINIIDQMDSHSILELMLLLRRTAKQQPVAQGNKSDDIACKLHLPLERCHSSVEHILEAEWSSSQLCRSPQHAHAVLDKAVEFNVGKDVQDFATPRLGDLRESDQSPTAAIRAAAAMDQQPVVSNRLLAQLQQQERSAKNMGSLELMGQSVAVGQSTADFSLLQASHMELVPSSYGEQRPSCVHSSAASSERTCSDSKTTTGADMAGTNIVQHVRSISSCSSSSSASFKQFQQLGGSAILAGPMLDTTAANVAELAAGSTVGGSAAATAAATPAAPGPSLISAGSAEFETPPCISSPYEPAHAGRPPDDSKQAKGSELRQSALTGPVHSFQLHLPDVEDDDTASELALSDVVTPTAPAAAAAARFAALYSPASSSCRTPPSSIPEKRSALPSFSNSSSPASAAQYSAPAPAEKPDQQQQQQQQQQRAGSKPRGLGRVFGAIRRSLTGKQVKEEVAAASPAVAGAASKRPGAVRAGMPASAAGSRVAAASSAASLAVQSRLPSFTETQRVRQQTITGSGGSRTAGGKGHTPGSLGGSKSPYAASGYKPPGSVGSAAPGRAAAGDPAAAHHKSPLGQATVSPASRRAGASTPTASLAGAVPRVQSGTGGTSASAAQKTTAASPTGSAGLAWLKQHSSEHESNIGGLRTAPVSPCNSRPGSVASVRSVASAAPHVGAPSRIGAGTAGSASSSHMPGFKMTKQMVDAKQQPGPPKQQRTPVSTPGNSARSAATKTSVSSYMRQLSSPGDALAAASSRAGASRLPSSSGSTGGAGVTQQGLRGAQQKQGLAPSTLSPFTATAAGAGRAQRGLAAGNVSPAAGISRQVASRIGTGAAGKGGSQLRRSRSCGSLADMLTQGGDKTHDVSEVRKMWQQRAAEHKQQQQQQQQGRLHPRQQQQLAATSAGAAAAAVLSSKAGLTRIPSLGGSRIPSNAGAAPTVAAAAAAKPVLHGPEMTDSPPLSPVSGEVRLSRSRCGRGSDALGASDAVLPAFSPTAAGEPAVGCSFVPGLKMQGLLQRMDDAICELQPQLPAEVYSAPLATGNTAAGVGYSGQTALQQQHQLAGKQQADALNRQLF